jgi:methionine-rich copper-binding protein CopC
VKDNRHETSFIIINKQNLGQNNKIMLWDIVVQDTHVLSRMFAVAIDDWMNEWMIGSIFPL